VVEEEEEEEEEERVVATTSTYRSRRRNMTAVMIQSMKFPDLFMNDRSQKPLPSNAKTSNKSHKSPYPKDHQYITSNALKRDHAPPNSLPTHQPATEHSAAY
jgi:hypothetical protein